MSFKTIWCNSQWVWDVARGKEEGAYTTGLYYVPAEAVVRGSAEALHRELT